MSTATSVEAPGDAELISAVRGGDVDAYGALFERHVEAARRLARQLVPAGDAEDLVSEAFVKVLGVLQRGGGPDIAFRAYLLTSVRRLQVDRIRAGARLHTTDDMEAFDPGVPFRDTAVEGFESAAAARAFASLPERWQLVLWHTEVEGRQARRHRAAARDERQLRLRARLPRPRGAAPGLPDPARRRARGRHVPLDARPARRPTSATAISRRDATRVEGHLDECRSCMAIYLELTEVNSNLGAHPRAAAARRRGGGLPRPSAAARQPCPAGRAAGRPGPRLRRRQRSRHRRGRGRQHRGRGRRHRARHRRAGPAPASRRHCAPADTDASTSAVRRPGQRAPGAAAGRDPVRTRPTWHAPGSDGAVAPGTTAPADATRARPRPATGPRATRPATPRPSRPVTPRPPPRPRRPRSRPHARPASPSARPTRDEPTLDATQPDLEPPASRRHAPPDPDAPRPVGRRHAGRPRRRTDRRTA